MIEAAKISLTKMRNSILAYGAVACVLYIVFLLLMKAVSLLHVTELRWVNYVILCLLCIYQIKRWVSKTGNYVPFLQVFSTSFFTGIFSFALFSLFLSIYSRIDAEMNRLFTEHVPSAFSSLPSTVIFAEGAAISIIVALINLQYFRRYEEGEVAPKKAETTPKKEAVGNQQSAIGSQQSAAGSK